MSDFPTINASVKDLHDQLRQAIPDAIATGNPASKVLAPGFERRGGYMPIEDLLTDDMSDGSGFLRHGLLRLLTTAMVSTDPAVRIHTQAMVNEWSKRHADYHLEEAMQNARVTA